MREEFLHFIWRTRRFDASELRTTQGEILDILHPGEWNSHAGPDFFNARIRIGDTLWAGNVELHVRASDWLVHRHDADDAYRNVVLHVVLDEDAPIQSPEGRRMPCLALRSRIPARLQQTWFRLAHEQRWIPCSAEWSQTPALLRQNWLDRLLVERLETKTGLVEQVLHDTGNHWEEAFYRLLARHYGLKVNAEPFEWLARATPLSLIARHRHQWMQVEALLFGQAGFLEEPFADDYPAILSREYRFLRHKYRLRPMDRSVWKFFRLRPAGFPTVRLAQLASLVHSRTNLFSAVMEAANRAEAEALFTLPPSEYWRTHYRFDCPSVALEKVPGPDLVNGLLINTVVPVMFHYGRQHGQPAVCDQAIALLDDLPAEDNKVIAGWRELGEQVGSAAHSQALLHLKANYCDVRRCLECPVGAYLLK
ncbi:MAG: DUF2851 family protein [Saprospiraceae bacterium]|nr:DUF2851 family protein [Saprospiraceae bacterium]